jgi:hypothetical protein
MQEIANDILTEQTPKRLHQVRAKVYELLINVVPPELIMRQLTQELLKKVDDEVKHQVRSSISVSVSIPICKVPLRSARTVTLVCRSLMLVLIALVKGTLLCMF